MDTEMDMFQRNSDGQQDDLGLGTDEEDDLEGPLERKTVERKKKKKKKSKRKKKSRKLQIEELDNDDDELGQDETLDKDEELDALESQFNLQMEDDGALSPPEPAAASNHPEFNLQGDDDDVQNEDTGGFFDLGALMEENN
uniref:Uncharacterized protein n=1 Tax=Lotharella globosa TaxID=91324 RepID=A0A6V3KLS9_9EUKA